MPRLSVVLSIFDQPHALAFSLAGYGRQTYTDFELIVADDGSDGETKEVLEAARKASGFPIKHVWQENKGYRRSRIANEAVRASEGEIIVLTDGDCIPSRDFLHAHAEAGGPNTFCTGGYVRLSPEQSQALTRERILDGGYEEAMTADDRKRFRWMHFKSRLGVLLGQTRKPKVYGCNISVWRDAYYAVNGYDENFDGFGKEDSDLRNRLRRHGVRPVSLWGKAWVYHVDDVIDPKIRERRIPRTDARPYYYRGNVPVRCENGLVKNGS